MTTDVFIVGLFGLSVVLACIVYLSPRGTDKSENSTDRTQKSSDKR